MNKIVKLSKEETLRCKEIALKEGRDKSVQWSENEFRKGFLGRAATFLGIVGEYSVDKTFFNQGVDESVSVTGDGGKDFNVHGIKIDVKCQITESSSAIEKGYLGGFYTMAVDKNSNDKDLKYDMIFFTTVHALLWRGRILTDLQSKRNLCSSDKSLSSPERWMEIEGIAIELCGYIWKDDILRNKDQRKDRTLMRSNGGNNYNYYICRDELILPRSRDDFNETLKKRDVSN
jgi:hypothetical protein